MMTGPRLRARVHRSTGATEHLRSGQTLPVPSSVEIQPVEGAYFLLYLDEVGDCIADTWHRTLGEAKSQATHEFGISESDWEVV